MFVGQYVFEGDSVQLLAAYDRMLAQFPVEEIQLHVCVETPAGITIYDGCPNAAEFESFSTSSGFRSALQSAGLPEPKVVPLGIVHSLLTPR